MVVGFCEAMWGRVCSTAIPLQKRLLLHIEPQDWQGKQSGEWGLCGQLLKVSRRTSDIFVWNKRANSKRYLAVHHFPRWHFYALPHKAYGQRLYGLMSGSLHEKKKQNKSNPKFEFDFEIFRQKNVFSVLIKKKAQGSKKETDKNTEQAKSCQFRGMTN